MWNAASSNQWDCYVAIMLESQWFLLKLKQKGLSTFYVNNFVTHQGTLALKSGLVINVTSGWLVCGV